jgi:hypothetical protein
VIHSGRTRWTVQGTLPRAGDRDPLHGGLVGGRQTVAVALHEGAVVVERGAAGGGGESAGGTAAGGRREARGWSHRGAGRSAARAPRPPRRRRRERRPPPPRRRRPAPGRRAGRRWRRWPGAGSDGGAGCGRGQGLATCAAGSMRAVLLELGDVARYAGAPRAGPAGLREPGLALPARSAGGRRRLQPGQAGLRGAAGRPRAPAVSSANVATWRTDRWRGGRGPAGRVRARAAGDLAAARRARRAPTSRARRKGRRPRSRERSSAGRATRLRRRDEGAPRRLALAPSPWPCSRAPAAAAPRRRAAGPPPSSQLAGELSARARGLGHRGDSRRWRDEDWRRAPWTCRGTGRQRGSR